MKSTLLWCEPECLFVLLLSLPKDPYPIIYCKDWCPKACPYVFFKEFYSFRSDTQVFHLFCIYSCIWCKILVQFHYFELCIFSHCVFLSTVFQIDWLYTWVHIWALCYMFGVCVCVCVPETYCFDYLAFCVVWNQGAWYLKVCFFSRWLWLYGVFCGSTHILGLFVQILWKKAWVFW